MANLTERTIRTGSQWVKIIRNAGQKVFTFHRGYTGCFSATSETTYPMQFVRTWGDAEEKAKELMAQFD